MEKGHSENCKYTDDNKMQYSIWVPEDKGFLIDVMEYSYMDDFLMHNVELPEFEFLEEETRLVVALGTFSFQKNREAGPKVGTITDCIGHAHLTLTEAGWVQMELVDVALYGEVLDFDVPVAALFRTSLVLPSIENVEMAMTVFIKYDSMTPITNILNRPGIFSLKDSIEDVTISSDNWLDFVSYKDVMKAHEYIWRGTAVEQHSDLGVC